VAIDQERYRKIVGTVIDKLEGGYYHPDMLADGRVRDRRYGISGETMFGIDRRKGGTINTSPAGKQFWALIDKANARKKWPWLYPGGELGPQLKNLAGDMIYAQYDINASNSLTPQSRAIVESDDRLLFNFIYTTWNGTGWFDKFAKKFNAAVASGITNKDQLLEVLLAARAASGSSLLIQGGRKIAQFINQIFGNKYTDQVKAFVTKYGDSIVDAISDTGIFFQVAVAQLSFETAWGTTSVNPSAYVNLITNGSNGIYRASGAINATTPEEQIQRLLSMGYSTFIPMADYLKDMEQRIAATRELYQFGRISSTVTSQ